MLETGFVVIGVISKEKKKTEIISDYCDSFENFCKKTGIPFHKFQNINKPEAIATIRLLAPEIILVLGWSQIIKDEIFSIPKKGIFGSHPSLLPKNRGNAVIPWQIINNEKESGFTFFRLEPNKPVDSGDIYAQKKFNLEVNETANSFYEKAVCAAEEIIERDLEGILLGKKVGIVQDEQMATYLGKRKPEDGKIDWAGDAEYIERFVRAVGNPYPGAFTYFKYNKIIVKCVKVSRKTNYIGVTGSVLKSDEKSILVQCGRGLLEIESLSDEFGKQIPLDSIKPGSKFGIDIENEVYMLKNVRE
jgi:methionyl-tRNA formyltransferase